MPPSNGTFSYTVTATFEDERVLEEWVLWLRTGHLADVELGGALSSEVIRFDLDGDTPSLTCEARYRFESRETFARYVREFAPALRAEGLAKFPPERGVQYRRATGTVVAGRS